MEVLECRRCESRWPEHHYRIDTRRQVQEKESHALFCALCEAEQMEEKRLDEIYICGEAMNTEHENRGCKKAKQLREFAPAFVRSILNLEEHGKRSRGYRCRGCQYPVCRSSDKTSCRNPDKEILYPPPASLLHKDKKRHFLRLRILPVP